MSLTTKYKKIGIIGLGKMGNGIAEHLLEQKYTVIAMDINPKAAKRIGKKGAIIVKSNKEIAKNLSAPRIILIIIPAGTGIDMLIENLIPYLSKGDIIIDVGNSFYEDSIKRANKLKKKGIFFIDIGTSGGIEGARHGACLTIGGDKKAFNKIEYIIKTIAAPEAYLYVGPSGSGHFVKMVHNGIEYCFLQAIGEGLELADIVSKDRNYGINLGKLCKVWSKGSIIQSRLIENATKVFELNPKLEGISGKIGGGETGTWSLKTAKRYHVPVPSLEVALKARKNSKKKSFPGKIISAIRSVFGGHKCEILKNKE